MHDFPSDDDRVATRRHWNAILLGILIVGCALSVWVWDGARRADRRVVRERFERVAEMTARLAEDHVHLVEGALRSSRGLVLGSERVEPDEWRRFAASLREHRGLPGVRELALLVPRDDGIAVAIRETDAAACPEIAGEAFARAAERARDEARPTVASIATPAGAEDTIHVLLPVYASGISPDGAEARRSGLRGWVCAWLDPVEAFGATLGDDADRLRVRIVGAPPGEPGNLVYDSAPGANGTETAAMTAQFPLAVADRGWSVRIDSRPAFDAAETGRHPVVLAIGIALSVALWGGGRAVLAARDAALRAADARARELRWAEGRYREVFLGGAQVQLLVHPEDGRILDANPAACTFYGYDPDRLRRMSLATLAAADGGDVDAVLCAGENDSGAREVRLRQRLASGLVRDVEVAACRIRVEQRSAIHLAVRDVTAREEVERIQRITARVFETASEAILVTDRYNRIDMVNPAFTRISGYTAADARGRDLSMLEAGLNPQSLLRDIQRGLARDGVWYGEIQCRRADGEVHPGRLSISTIEEEDGRAARHVVVFSDLSVRGRMPGERAGIAHVDALTGLPDRALFLDRLGREVEHARRDGTRVAILVVDLDRFREVNEILGHPGGDAALREVASRLVRVLRSSDTIARLGGDEFAIVAPAVGGPTDGSDLARRVLSALIPAVKVGDKAIEIRGSAGVALYPDDAPDAERLLRHAESALTRAKTSPTGERYRFFSSETDDQARARAAKTGDLLRALDRGEFELVWQPVWDLEASRIAGAEALLRWRHPVRGLLEPPRFLPGAADAHLLVGIGSWVVREACRQAADWCERGVAREFAVGVNLAGEELRDDAMVSGIEALAGACGEPAMRLSIEIPESALIRQGARLADPLARLHASGIDVLVDDAGLHDPVLRYLDGLPVDGIKIHGSLLTDPSSARPDAALRVVAEAARARGIRLWGEGIETDASLAALRRVGGTLAQGIVFGGPIPAAELERRLTTEGPSA